MLGLIKSEVIEAVKARVAIEDVVRDHVALRRGGVGTLKGLCPFHDEKTPSFQVRPQVGLWHCFGCGQGGDLISFVQRIDHLTFSEAVERLADKVGIPVEFEQGSGRPREEVGRRGRLLAANLAAEQWFAEQLFRSEEAAAGRTFLAERGFDREIATVFKVGYAPNSGTALLKFLRDKGYTDDEAVKAGLVGLSQRGPYDRFRGRLIWPIHDIAGDCIAFGARKLYDDDRIAAKYLNTPETALFKKSQVLYGLDLAKKAIAAGRKAVVVEGYTDVMACRAAGIETVVATCGTAFGADHVRVLRRVLGDSASNNAYSTYAVHESNAAGEIIFTFDGDLAGRKAALRAFDEDNRFASQTFVAAAPSGLDPCDLRQQHGDQAVRALIENPRPLFEFAISAVIGQYNLDTPPGRVQAVQAAAPIVAKVKGIEMQKAFARQLAGLVGADIEQVTPILRRAMRSSRAEPADTTESRPEPVPAIPRPDLTDAAIALERQLLQLLVQRPQLLTPETFAIFTSESFRAPMHQAVYQAVIGIGGLEAVADSSMSWVDRVAVAAPDGARAYVTELAVSELPIDDEAQLQPLATSVQSSMVERDLTQREVELRSRMQRYDAAGDAMGYRAALLGLHHLVLQRSDLRARSQ